MSRPDSLQNRNGPGTNRRETHPAQIPERKAWAGDEFLEALSHDLRTPLNTILLWLDVLRAGKGDEAKLERAAGVIEGCVLEQGQRLNDFLDLYRIQSGSLSLKLTQVAIHERVAAALSAVRSLADSKELTTETSFDPAVNTMSADPDRLEQIFRNILLNAVKFTTPPGRITVRSKRIDNQGHDQIQVQVEDNGRGIAPELLPHLFTRFRQGNKDDSGPAPIEGLGLSIVRGLVELHGGKITAESPGEGKGAVFTMTFPCPE